MTESTLMCVRTGRGQASSHDPQSPLVSPEPIDSTAVFCSPMDISRPVAQC
jgi:hypothetical protein